MENIQKIDNIYNENDEFDFKYDFDEAVEPIKVKKNLLFKDLFIKKLISYLRYKYNDDYEKCNKTKASKKGNLEERMEYYKKKYGVNFIPSKELREKESDND